jgi:recombination protein RecR
MPSADVERLIQLLGKLPGLGPRSARRGVLHLLKRRDTLLGPLISAFQAVEANLKTCSVCGNVDTSDPCGVCLDERRDPSLLCVVEDIADLWAMDRSGAFRGRYHVLGGRLSALDGVRPENLSIEPLVARVADRSGASPIREVILAMNATLEGQTTAHYVAERLSALGVPVTQLAHGVPVGGELDYLDEGTLGQALKARRPLG